jgi:hypothetical protein
VESRTIVAPLAGLIAKDGRTAAADIAGLTSAIDWVLFPTLAAIEWAAGEAATRSHHGLSASN